MDVHFNSYKVKYQSLNYFMRPIRNSQKVYNVNIFIDLDDVFHSLHRPLINNEFQVCGRNAPRQLISNVMNLAGHYRNWAIKEHLNPMVYLTYSGARKRFKNNIYIPDYRQRFFDINSENHPNYFFINQSIRQSYDILHIICKYITGVYIIDSKYIEPSVIPNFLSGLYPADWNILISRDVYSLQYCYKDRWSMISPKGDNSRFITKDTLWHYICDRERVFKEDEKALLNYDPQLYVIAKAIVGDKYRSIPRLKRCGWKTIFKYLDEAFEASKSSGNLYEVQEKYLTDLITDKKMNFTDIENNNACIDIEWQTSVLLDTDKNLILNQITDMEDYNALVEIDNRYFSQYPINLNFLCNRIQMSY